VYGISDVELVPLLHPSVRGERAGSAATAAAEKRYKRLLMSGLDLTKDFYFSYSYDLCATLQANLTAPAANPFASRFAWNEYLTRSLRGQARRMQLTLLCAICARLPVPVSAIPSPRHGSQVTSEWLLPVLHGFWQQKRLSVFGHALTLTLVSRRSRYFAGTRYLKRGVNNRGDVANDVETEQIVETGEGSVERRCEDRARRGWWLRGWWWLGRGDGRSPSQ